VQKFRRVERPYGNPVLIYDSLELELGETIRAETRRNLDMSILSLRSLGISFQKQRESQLSLVDSFRAVWEGPNKVNPHDVPDLNPQHDRAPTTASNAVNFSSLPLISI
jgi:hypothetical protein